MAKCCNLVINYDAIFGMTVASIQNKAVRTNSNADKAKVKIMAPNKFKAIHLRKIKLT